MYTTRNNIRHRVKMCFLNESVSLVKENVRLYNCVGHDFLIFKKYVWRIEWHTWFLAAKFRGVNRVTNN